MFGYGTVRFRQNSRTVNLDLTVNNLKNLKKRFSINITIKKFKHERIWDAPCDNHEPCSRSLVACNYL